MSKLSAALFLCLLAGCATAPPPEYSICSSQPGTYACQVEQYRNTDS